MDNNKLLNVNDCLIELKKVAELKNVTPRAIRLAIQRGKYISRATQTAKGQSYQILLSSLEKDIQDKYLKEYHKSLLTTEEPLIVIQPKKDYSVPEKARELALAKYDLIQLWLKFRKENPPTKIANKTFIELYNTGEFAPEIFKKLGKTAIGSIYRWHKTLGKSKDYTKLIANYNYANNLNYRSVLAYEEKQLFLKVLLAPNAYSIGKAISMIKYILNRQGVEQLPSDITFRRYADWFKKYNYDKWILSRYGEKALKDKVEPFLVRNVSLLGVGQVLVADGHRLNFQVINPFTGKPARATLVGFLDWRSNALVGYEIMLEENTQCIASALRNAILNMGKIPDFVYQDNGKAFKSKYFQDSKSFDELGFDGLYSRLGVKAIFAKPYNARAKVIERFFLEFQESFEKMLPSYIGTSIEKKPAYLKRNEKLHKEIHNSYIPTIQEAMRMIDCWLEYRHSQPCPNQPDKTISEVLATIKNSGIKENELDALNDLMMATTVKTVGRNGIRFLKADYFDEVLYGFRDKIKIKYSLFDLTKIKVYTMKNEFLCEAQRVKMTHPLANHLGTIKDMEDFKQKIQKPKQLRQKTIKEVKQFLSNEDVKFLEEQMELEDFKKLDDSSTHTQRELPNTAAPSSLENSHVTALRSGEAQPSASARFRFFSNDFERFDYLKNKSNLSEEESAWITWYKTTTEYKEMYA